MEQLPLFHIFLVDDEPFCLDLYKQYLANLGQEQVSTYSSSAECLEQLTRQPDLIFLDYQMDAINGLDILKKIKRINPNALVVFISGQEEIEVAVNALKYGALDYISKDQVTEARLQKVLVKARDLRQMIASSQRRSWLKKVVKGIGLWSLFLLLFSCKTQNLFQTPAGASGDDSVFLSVNGDYQYNIRKDDKIAISVWDHDDLSVGSLYGIYNSNEVYGKWLMVNAEGNINVPKIGPFHIKDLTVIQAEDGLRRLFGKWIRDPVVEVKVLNKEITMLGELKSPGKFLLEKDDNRLVELLGKAGDFDFYANKRDIRIIRMVHDHPAVMKVDLTRMDHYAEANVRIIPGDVIYVPSKKGKDFEKRLSTILPLISVATGFAIVYKAFF